MDMVIQVQILDEAFTKYLYFSERCESNYTLSSYG